MRKAFVPLVLLVMVVSAWAYLIPIDRTITFSMNTLTDTLSTADTVTASGSHEVMMRGADALILRAIIDGPFPALTGLGAVDSAKLAVRTLGPVDALVMDSIISGTIPCTLDIVVPNTNDTTFKRALRFEYAVWDTSLDTSLTVNYKLKINGDLIFDGR